MSFTEGRPPIPATVSHLHGIKTELLVAMRDERAALMEQLVVMRQDLFAILARLPGGSPELPGDSDISSRRSHGSLLSDQSGSEGMLDDEDDVERKSGMSLEGEFLGGAAGPAATCPELAEFQRSEGDPAFWATNKTVTCPELEEIDDMRLSIESVEPPQTTKAAAKDLNPTTTKTNRYGTRKSKITSRAGSKEHCAKEAVPPQKTPLSTPPKMPAQVGASSSSTEPPAILQDLMREAQQRERDRKALEDSPISRIAEDNAGLKDIESLTLPGQPEMQPTNDSLGAYLDESSVAAASSSSWLPGHSQLQTPGSASAAASEASGARGNVEEPIQRKSQRKQSAHSVTFSEQRGSDPNSARVESMPELPELDGFEESLLFDGDDLEAQAPEPHRRRARKVHTYPMLAVQMSDSSEHDENEPLMAGEREDAAAPSAAASSRPTPMDEESQPLAVVPTPSLASSPAHKRPEARRREGAAADERRSGRDEKRGTGSFMDIMPSFGMSWGFTGPASLIGTTSGSSSSAGNNKWSYLALKRKSKEPGSQNLDKLEQQLSQRLFASQQLIPKTPSPLSSHAQKPKVSRFALPSQKSRIRGHISNRPRRSFPLDRRSLSGDLTNEERSASRSTPTSSVGRLSPAVRVDPALFGSEPASMKIRGNIGAGRLSSLGPQHRMLKQNSERTGSSTRPPTSSRCDSSRGGLMCSVSTTSRTSTRTKHSSVEALRHQQEQDILKAVQEGRHVSFGRIDETIVSSHSAPPSLGQVPGKCVLSMVTADVSARICGIAPLSSKFKMASVAYRGVLVLLISASAIRPAIQIFSACFHDQNKPLFMQGPWPTRQSFLSTCLDMTSALGALLGLLSVGVIRSKREALADAAKVLHNYTLRNELQTIWGNASKRDQFLSYAIFLGLVLVRFFLGYYEDTAVSCVWQTATFTFTTMVTMGLVGYIMHVCRGLVAVVDAFCQNVVDHPDFGTAVREWGLVQAMLRSTSAALQTCFMALLTVATVIVLVTLVDFSNHRSISAVLIPSLLLAVAILRIPVWAAEVTDKCQRVPLLVNSLSIGTDLDVNRMYTVDYIVHCQAGFYIFEMRLTCSTLMKAIYIACAVTVGISTQIDQRV